MWLVMGPGYYIRKGGSIRLAQDISDLLYLKYDILICTCSSFSHIVVVVFGLFYTYIDIGSTLAYEIEPVMGASQGTLRPLSSSVGRRPGVGTDYIARRG